MPRYKLTFGFDLVFTAVIPPRAMDFLKDEKRAEGFGLTPYFAAVPSGLVVSDIRDAGIATPEHWEPTNVVWPIIDGVAFYIVPTWSESLAVSLAMKGVNLRTGLQEQPILLDDPCQSYWSGRRPPWIDGYRPSSALGVRQFLPLRGEAEMSLDVARFVGVRPNNPLIDAITATFFLPADVRQLTQEEVVYRGGYEALESSAPRSLGIKSPVEEVGMGAGAVMKQRHPENPMVTAADFLDSPITVTTRLAWVDWWNTAAKAVGIDPITVIQMNELHRRQKKYEQELWAHLDVPVNTAVDSFPMP